MQENKGRHLVNTLYGVTQGMEKVIPKIENYPENDIQYRWRYLKHFWPELATDAIFASEYFSYRLVNGGILTGSLFQLLKELMDLNIISYDDVKDFAISLVAATGCGYLISLIFLGINIFSDAYSSIPKNVVRDHISSNYLSDSIFEYSLPIALTNDGEMLGFLMSFIMKRSNYPSIIEIFLGNYYIALSERDNSWLEDILISLDRPDKQYIYILAEVISGYTKCISIAKQVFDATLMIHNKTPTQLADEIYLGMGHLSTDIQKICIEIIFRSGYFDYEFFSDTLVKNYPTQALKEWLEQVDI